MKKLLPLALGTASLVACAPVDVDVSLDEDGAVIGGEPTPEHVFYEGGGWEIATSCNEDLEVTGNAVGDVTAGTSGTDQFGDTVNLHDFCDRAILVVSAAFW
ncbi:MAG: hypothetical protein VX899_01345 [Myxococcota bacterium]|nr:hypothetical protein [Myxococcota bacterium]